MINSSEYFEKNMDDLKLQDTEILRRVIEMFYKPIDLEVKILDQLMNQLKELEFREYYKDILDWNLGRQIKDNIGTINDIVYIGYCADKYKYPELFLECINYLQINSDVEGLLNSKYITSNILRFWFYGNINKTRCLYDIVLIIEWINDGSDDIINDSGNFRLTDYKKLNISILGEKSMFDKIVYQNELIPQNIILGNTRKNILNHFFDIGLNNLHRQMMINQIKNNIVYQHILDYILD